MEEIFFPWIRKLILPPSFTSWVASGSWSDFITWFGASPAAQWAKDRIYFSSASPCSSCTTKYHTVSLRMTSSCEKHHLLASFASLDTWILLFRLLDSPVESPKCRGCFCDKGWKCENGPNLPLGSLEVFIYGELSPKFTMYRKQRLMVLWQEKIKMLITKVQKKHKNITGLKLRPTVIEKRKLRKVVRKRGNVSLYPYFHP